MRRWTVARAALGASALGAAIMLVVTTAKQPDAVSATRVGVTESPPTSTVTTTALPHSVVDAKAVAEQVLQAVRKHVSSAEVGMEVYDRQTGTVLTSLAADQQFSTMSVVKILIALDVLDRNDWALPSEATQAKLTRMLSASDDAIAGELWVAGGRTAIIDRQVTLLGLTGTEAPDDPGRWGDTQTTAQDLVTVYSYITGTLPAEDRALLYSAMYHASETGADGTDQYFGIPDGLPGTTWAIKQGWGSTGKYAFYNSTGLIGSDSRYVVVVLTSAPVRYYKTLPAALTAGTAALASVVSP